MMASKGRPIDEKTQTVVICKKPNGRKHTIHIFDGIVVDEILDNKIKKPLIPHVMEVVDLGIGKSFIEKYKKQYKIKD